MIKDNKLKKIYIKEALGNRNYLSYRTDLILLKILVSFAVFIATYFIYLSLIHILGRENELLKKLADSGCTTLSFGLESISKESLKGMNKSWVNPLEYTELIQNIHSHGIDVSTEMVVGGEGDTLQSIRDTKRFIENNKITVPRFYILTPIPGTKFFEDMICLLYTSRCV